MASTDRQILFFFFALMIVLALPEVSLAVDGVIEINQAKALAGGVTASDTAGFPVAIDESGSYRLTSNLVVGSTTGIVVSGEAVTIDLNGFSIEGPATGCPQACSGGGGDGIRHIVGTGRITIRNGTVLGMGGFGVYAFGNAIVSGLHVYLNAGTGIWAEEGSIIRGCEVKQNTGRGIEVGEGSVVSDNSVHESGQEGIVATAATVTGNSISGNAGVGIRAELSVIRGNSVTFNGGDGIDASDGSLVEGNTVRSNGGKALDLGSDVGYKGNVISGTVLGGVELGSNLCGSDTTCP